MASVNLSGVLLNPEKEPDVGAVVKFTLLTTTGDTVKSSTSELIVPPDGAYNIDIVYGNLRVDYVSEFTERFVAIVTVNGDTVATSLPELLNAAVPPTDAQLLEFQGILADAVTAQVAAEAAETGAVAAEATLLAEKLTTVQLIALSNSFAVGSVIDTLGYTSNGDGGGARWVKSGISGSTPSQSPAQKGGAVLSDGSGDVWDLVVGGAQIVAKTLGLVADGITDDYLALVACKAAAVVYVHDIYLPEGVIAIGTTLDLDVENTSLLGVGADRSHDVAGQFTLNSTQLKWIGASAGRMVQVTSPTGASNQKLVGGGVRGITFNANSLASEGLVVISRNSGLYSNIHFHEFTTNCLLVTAHTLGEAADPQLNTFKNITCRQFNKTGNFINLDGMTGANASMNSFYDCSASIVNGDAYVLNNCDNNLFTRCRAVRAGGGTGNAILANGADDLVGSVARSNLFLAFSTNNTPILARGTETFVHASHNNRIVQADIDNATPVPTLGTGSTFWFDTDRNMQYNSGLVDCAMASTSAQIETLRGKMTTETRRVKNDANNHEIWESGDSTAEWGINVDNTTGDMRFVRLLGTGVMQFDRTLNLINQSTGTAATAGGASALPALPQGYLRVEVNGTIRKLPYYQE